MALAPEQQPWPRLDLKADGSRDDAAPKPYFPLILALLVAAGSSTGMLYFGWLAFDYRARYRGLLREMLGEEDPLPQLDGHLQENPPAGAPRDSRSTRDRADRGRAGQERNRRTWREPVVEPLERDHDWPESDGELG